MTSPQKSGFTLIELLTVVAIIGILAAILLPALSSGKGKALAATCLSNQKQLSTGWTLYQGDYKETLPPNNDHAQNGKDAEHPSWVAGRLRTYNEPGGKMDSVNTDLLVSPAYREFGSIGTYVQNPKIYKCPEDKSFVNIDGQRKDRVRTLSMNSYLHGTGMWQSTNYVTFRTMAEMPDPSSIWVFMDEREDSINDGYFAVEMELKYAVIDYPAIYHKGRSAMIFADGHTEFHQWVEPSTQPKMVPGEHLPGGPKYTHAADRDIQWLQSKTTFKK